MTPIIILLTLLTISIIHPVTPNKTIAPPISLPSPPLSLPLSTSTRSRQSTIQIGRNRNNQQSQDNSTSQTKSHRTRLKTPLLTLQTTTIPPPRLGSIDGPLYAGLVLPHSMFQKRDYWRVITSAMGTLKFKYEELFNKHFNDEPNKHLLIRMITPSPSPKDILSLLCDDFLTSNVTALIYLSNSEAYGTSTAASQYFLQLAGYLGLPVISWNADNSGLRRRATSSATPSNTEMSLQLAPSIHHQTSAMLSILQRYNWHQFAIVTSQIAGHDDFVQSIRDRVLESPAFKFIILANVLVLNESDLAPLVGSEARILLLYCTNAEARWILRSASNLGLTESNYVWIVTQSVIGEKVTDLGFSDLPIGMLGVHFNTTMAALKSEISTAVRVFVSGVHAFRNDSRNSRISLKPTLSCDGSGSTAKWSEGDHFYRSLRTVAVDHPEGKVPRVSFNLDGTMQNTELKIMNLRPMSGISEKSLVWEQIGVWRSWRDPGDQLDIKDIVWPGKSHKPPDGVPEKFHLKVTFLEEAPYIRTTDPDPITGKCSPDRGVLCRINEGTPNNGLNAKVNGSGNADNLTVLSNYACCSGFNIDLLLKFAEDIGFTYELMRVPDSKWGSYVHHKWNGMIGELTNRRVDLALASLMINSEREAVVDFSVPYMDSGIAVMTAKRTGIVSPTAFLEPFDASLWFLVCVVGIQVYSLFIFFFEWLSPLGFDMKKFPKPGSRFSFFRSCWLVWARLFQASVHVDPPRGFTAKFVVHVWSMFAVVFLATYTANLAVFMITREESHQFTGVNDQRLSNPTSQKPAMKFGTVVNTHAANLFGKHHPEMFTHMKMFNVQNVSEGVEAVRKQELDAFLYDGPVLQYEVLQDTSETCQLLIEGSWYAHTGYGLAFPRNSKYLQLFNKFLMEYKENGDLERLRRFYFTGPCSAEQGNRQQQQVRIGKFNTFGTGPLALEQFLSVFLLLGIGVLVACVFVFCERAYANCIVKRVFGGVPVCSTGGKEDTKQSQDQQRGSNNKKPPPACLQLLSQNMGLPYSRTFYRAHKRDSKIRLLDHITNSFTIYDNPGGGADNTISDYYHGFLESFVLRKMITCNDPICQRNFIKLENELKKCLIRLRQIENWGRMCYLEDSQGKSQGSRGNRSKISTIDYNAKRNEIVGKRICGDYSDYSIFSGTVGGGAGLRDEVLISGSVSSALLRKRSGSIGSCGGLVRSRVNSGVIEDHVVGDGGSSGIGRAKSPVFCTGSGVIKVAEIETVL